MHPSRTRALVGGATGILTGVLAGIGLLAIAAAGAAGPRAGAEPDGARLIQAAHVPPVLTRAGEQVTLRFAIVCAPRDDGGPCDGSGEVYIRAGQSGPFQRLALTRGDESKDGRYFVDVPQKLAAGGFSYYAVLHDNATGAAVTVPAGGADAPQRSLPLAEPVDVHLPTHAFGRLRKADARVVDARWGSSPGRLGLAGGRELGFVGPSSFDVEPDATITVLDQVNGRLSRWSPPGGQLEVTPIDVAGVISDLAVEPDGSVDVLESQNRITDAPMLRSFARDGRLRWSQRLADRTWAKLARGPFVLQEPSAQWLPAGTGGMPLARPEQARRARIGRPLPNGHELVVERSGVNGLRIAETAGATVQRSWAITSVTPLGEVQLAEPLGNRVVVVLKTYTDEQDEFLVLVLDKSGLVQQQSLAPWEWAEAAPLSRFRLAKSSLYQLGSTPAGAFVDRFDLEVPR